MQTKYISHSLLVIFLGINLFSCIKPVDDFDLKDSKRKIVVNGILDPDSIFKLQVVSSVGALEKEELKLIENASINVYDGNTLLFQLEEFENGFYFNSAEHPKNGLTYTITVDANGFESVKARVTMPKQIQVLSLDTNTVIERNQQVGPGDGFKIETTVFNNANENNYFMIEAKSGSWAYRYDYSNVDGPWDGPKIIDSAYIYGNNSLYSKDVNAELGVSNSYVEDYENWTGEYEKSGSLLVYSDKLLGNKNVQINAGIDVFDYYDQPDSIIQLKVSIAEVSEDFYYYMKAYSHYSDDPFDRFFAESVTLYSNVENGMGLVFGKSSHVETFEYKRKD